MIEAVISDIHSNIDALEAVLADIKKRDIKRIVCLGDVIGYGSMPAECLEKAMEFDVCLMGNHEWAVINEAVGFNLPARNAVEYSRNQVKPGFLKFGRGRGWEFINSLPDRHEEDEGMYLFVHGSPTSPIEEYVLKNEVDETLQTYTKKIEKAFDNTKWVALLGHTHTPGIISTEAKYVHPSELEGPYQFEPEHKYLVNVGSVGQPRDNDPRACYALLDRDDNRIEYVRVKYDVEKAMERIRKVGLLDDVLADRLGKGT